MGSDIQRERKENYWRTYGGWYRIGVEVGNYYLRLYYYYFRLFFHLGHTYLRIPTHPIRCSDDI
jgi:hypothetical protein